jgi:hypothetical protein
MCVQFIRGATHDIASSAPSFTNGAFQGDLKNSLDYKSDVFLLGILKTF